MVDPVSTYLHISNIGLPIHLPLNILLKTFDILQQMEVETRLQNDNNYSVDNQSMIIEVVLFDRITGGNLVVTGLGLKVFLGILLLIMETIGNYLLFCMVWYEKFGMDSKKRTITDQLFSRMILVLILFNIFFMPLFFGAFLIPYSEYFQVFYGQSLGQRLKPNFYSKTSISKYF